MLGRARQEETRHSIRATWERGTAWKVGSPPHKQADLQPEIQSRAQTQRKAGQWGGEIKMEEPWRWEQYGWEGGRFASRPRVHWVHWILGLSHLRYFQIHSSDNCFLSFHYILNILLVAKATKISKTI